MMQRVHGDTEGEQNNATITYYMLLHCVTNLGFVTKVRFINLDNVGMDRASSQG